MKFVAVMGRTFRAFGSRFVRTLNNNAKVNYQNHELYLEWHLNILVLEHKESC
jgi:hypothetical protein